MTRSTHRPGPLVNERKRVELPWRYRPSLGKPAAVGIAVASLVTLAVIAGALMHANTDKPLPAAKPPTSAAGPRPPIQAPSAAPAPASPVASDDRGFRNSYARCDGSPPAAAIGRTARSLVVICRAGNGTLLYKGIRLSQGTGVTIDAVTPDPSGPGTGFVAHGGGINYTVSPVALIITSGNKLLASEPMLEYRMPSAQPAPPRPSSPPSPAGPPTPGP